MRQLRRDESFEEAFDHLFARAQQVALRVLGDRIAAPTFTERLSNQWLTAVSRPLNFPNFLRLALGEPLLKSLIPLNGLSPKSVSPLESGSSPSWDDQLGLGSA